MGDPTYEDMELEELQAIVDERNWQIQEIKKDIDTILPYLNNKQVERNREEAAKGESSLTQGIGI